MNANGSDGPDADVIEVSDSAPTPNVVFVLRGPGAGKGTMCGLAEAQLGWTHLSIGTLLRNAREVGGPTAAIIDEHIAAMMPGLRPFARNTGTGT